MASVKDIKITYEIEPVVKLTCFNASCRFWNSVDQTCNLKRVTLDNTGRCVERENNQ